MEHAIGTGKWTLEIVEKDGTIHPISFVNETVACYVADPVALSDLPAK